MPLFHYEAKMTTVIARLIYPQHTLNYLNVHTQYNMQLPIGMSDQVKNKLSSFISY